jgi:hypothetical protein
MVHYVFYLPAIFPSRGRRLKLVFDVIKILAYQNMVKMKSDAKICNCRHIKKYEKNIKNSKSSIRFLSHVSPHHKDKKIWSHHIYAIGSIKSTFHKGEAQIFLFFSFTSHQIRLNPIVTDRQPTYFTIFKKRLWLELVIGITLKLVIVIHLR